MQLATAKFTKNDLAKYPFLKETTEYVRNLNFKIEDLTDPALANILECACERIEEAILYATTTHKPHNPEIEILSFPVALMLTIATENTFIKKRYALAEAKQAHENMQQETTKKITTIAQNFQWNLTTNTDSTTPHQFKLHFTDYLRNTTHLRDKKWKLVNRPLSNGYVHLNKNDIIRLLSEEVRRQIEKRLDTKELPKLPSKLTETTDKIKQLSLQKTGKTETEGFPKTIEEQAFPPCIKALYQAFTSGRHLSHIGRFTLTSFLVNIGMTPDALIELFRSISDFNERMTRYQVEHIAGEKGSRIKYIPPKCETLQTHSVCTNPDETCKKTRHPLGYYRRKLRTR